MSPEFYMKFLGRSSASLVSYLVAQSASELDVKLDIDRFLSSFCYVDSNGEHRRVGSWEAGSGWHARSRSPSASEYPSGPTHRSDGSSACDPADLMDQTDTISNISAKWKSYCDKYAGHLPFPVAYLKSVMPSWKDGTIIVFLPSSAQFIDQVCVVPLVFDVEYTLIYHIFSSSRQRQ